MLSVVQADGALYDFGDAPASIDHFEWDLVASPQTRDVPFSAQIRAADSNGWTVTGFNDTVDLSGWTGDGTSSTILITECNPDSPDYVEIQNVSGASVDTTGWTVALNDAALGSINAVHSVTWSLPGAMGAGEIMYRTDSSSDNYWGSNIWWVNRGWAMIVDDAGDVADFVVWGYTSSQIAGMSVDVNAHTVTVGSEWSGDGVAFGGSSSLSLQRSGNSDNNDADDLSWVTRSKGTQNTGLGVPFSSPVSIVPDSATFVAGVWTGNVTVFEVVDEMYLHADDGSGHIGDGNAFDVHSFPTDFGDAPDPTYPTLSHSNGARHVISSLFLGADVDADSDGQPNATATGDDTDGNDDDDGVVFTSNLYATASANVDITASAPGRLDAWIDFNGDGDWADAGEQIFVSDSLTAGVNHRSFAVPGDAIIREQTFARFRISTAGGLSHLGGAADGEVEDYAVIIEPPLEFVIDADSISESAGMGAATVTVTRNAGTVGDLLLTLTSSDTSEATVPATITIPAGFASATFAVDAVDELFVDGAQTLTISATGPGVYAADTLTVNDDDVAGFTVAELDGSTRVSESGTTDTFAVVLSAGPLTDVVITLASSDPGEATFDQASLTFTPTDWHIPQTVSVSSVDDVMLDGDQTTTITVSVDDTNSHDAFAALPDQVVLVLTTDDGVAQPDFGDAPLPYPTTAGSNGARHAPTGPRLGVYRDGESDGAPSSNADGDDTSGMPDDEDGVTFGSIRVGQTDASVTVNVQNAPSGAKLDAWIDFNGDGSWGGALEQIADRLTVTEGDNVITFDVPSWATSGETYARFRLSTAGDLAPSGAAFDGEVEDHSVNLIRPVPTSGVFGTRQIIATDARGARNAIAADLDADGDLDILSVSALDHEIFWYANTGLGTFGTQQVVATNTGYVTSVFALDLDGDGDQDVLSASGDDDSIAWYENYGDGTFGTQQVITTDADSAESVFAADLDGDGDQDVLSASLGDGKIAWYENDGNGTFAAQKVLANAYYPRSVFAADLDGDGDEDVLSASSHDDKIAWYENNGMGAFGSQHAITTDADWAKSVFSADLDGDGDQDVLSASYYDDKIAWYENTGGGIFGGQRFITTNANGARSVFAADLDGDGDQDVLSASPNDDKIAWYENVGGGTFGPQRVITTDAWEAESVLAADLDGDGDLDVLSVWNSKVAWYENLGFDYGDAPVPYPTLGADGGATHKPTGPTLGSSRDDEQDGQPTDGADGDDLTGTPDDEDGVTAAPLLAPCIVGTTLTVEASGPSFLNAWIDFNRNGIWDASEQVAVDVALHAGSNEVSFDVPISAIAGQTYARLRLTSYDTGGTLAPTGRADDGEVEDYAWTIENYLDVVGNDGLDDVISVWVGAPGGFYHQVEINGTVSHYDAAVYHVIRVDGLGGNDTITVHGTGQDETVALLPSSVDVLGQTYRLAATGIENVTVNAGTGTDQVTMTGSAGSNRLYSYPDYARLSDSPRTYSYRVDGFDTIDVDAPGTGRDYAYLHDSPGNDELDAAPDDVVFRRAVGPAEETVTTAAGFQRVYAYATGGGGDSATLTGDDTTRNRFYGYADYSILTESRRAFYFYARGFDEVTAESPGSQTSYAYLHDSSGVDRFEATPDWATMARAEGRSDTTATGFARVYGYSTRGAEDTAAWTGSATGGNQYRGYPSYSTLTDSARSFYHYARGFHTVEAAGSQAEGAGDRAYLYDSRGDDMFDEAFLEGGKYQGGSLTDGSTYENWVKYFDLVYARSSDRGTDDTIDVLDEELLAYRLVRMGTW